MIMFVMRNVAMLMMIQILLVMMKTVVMIGMI